MFLLLRLESQYNGWSKTIIVKRETTNANNTSSSFSSTKKQKNHQYYKKKVSIDNIQRIFFIPPLQKRRLISYNAGLRMQAIFLIKAQFHPIHEKLLAARKRFHTRTSIKYRKNFTTWLAITRARIKRRNYMITKIQAKLLKMLKPN